MIIPQLDQDIATIKAVNIQHHNGHHISAEDIRSFNEAYNRLLKLWKEINNAQR